jgi:hypothetical protein
MAAILIHVRKIRHSVLDPVYGIFVALLCPSRRIFI